MLRESSLQELAWAWESISVEEQREALLGQRALLEELSPGSWKLLNAQRKEEEAVEREAEKAAKESRKIEAAAIKQAEKQARKLEIEQRRREKSNPIRIREIQASLRKQMHREGRQQMQLDRTREQLMDQIIKQIRTDS